MPSRLPRTPPSAPRASRAATAASSQAQAEPHVDAPGDETGAGSGDGPEPERDAISRAFGARVRRLREHARLTLDELAGRSGVSRAMLSKIERGERSPTLGVATRIAHAVDTSLSLLVGGQEHRRAVAVVRRGHRQVFRDPATGFERHLLSPPIAGAAVEVLYHHLPPQSGTGPLPPYPTGTEKHVVAAAGAVVVALPTGAVELRTGDALYFEADVAHAFENRTDAACEYYLVVVRCR